MKLWRRAAKRVRSVCEITREGLELIGKGGTSLFLEIYPGCQPHLVKLGRIYVNPPYHRKDKLENYPRYAHMGGGQGTGHPISSTIKH